MLVIPYCLMNSVEIQGKQKYEDTEDWAEFRVAAWACEVMGERRGRPNSVGRWAAEIDAGGLHAWELSCELLR